MGQTIQDREIEEAKIEGEPKPLESQPVSEGPPADPAGDLSPDQRKAIALLVSGMSITAVAKELNVNPCTIHRWRKIPAFAAELERLTLELRQHLEAKVLALGVEALETLEELINRAYSEHSRFEAAAFIVKQARN